MANILTDKSASLPQANKLDVRFVPPGQEQYYLSSSEWNKSAQFINDARVGLYHPHVEWSGSDSYTDYSTINTFTLTGSSRWIFVRPGGNDTSGDGTIGDPYATLQYALNQLPTHLGDTTYFIDVTGMNHDDAVSGTLIFPSCVGKGVAGAVHNSQDLRQKLELLPTNFPQGAPTEEYLGCWTAASQVNIIALPQKYDEFSFCEWRWPLAGVGSGLCYRAPFPPSNLLGVAVDSSILGTTSSRNPQLLVCEPNETLAGFSYESMYLLKHTSNFFPILSTAVTSSGAISYDLVGSAIGFNAAPVLSGALEVYTLGASMTASIIFNDMKYSLGFMGVDMNFTTADSPNISNSTLSFDICNLNSPFNQWIWNNSRVTLSRVRSTFNKTAPSAGSVTRVFGSAFAGFDNSDTAALPIASTNVSNCYLEEGDMDDHGAMFVDNSRLHRWTIADGDGIYFHSENCSFGQINMQQDVGDYSANQVFIRGASLVEDPNVVSGTSQINLANVVAYISLGHKGSEDPGFFPNRVDITLYNEQPVIQAKFALTDGVSVQHVDLSRSLVRGLERYSSSSLEYLRFAEMGKVFTSYHENAQYNNTGDGNALESYVTCLDAKVALGILFSASLSSGSTGIFTIGQCMDQLVKSEDGSDITRIVCGSAAIVTDIQRELNGNITQKTFQLVTGTLSLASPYKTIEYIYNVDGLVSEQVNTVYGYAGRPVASYVKQFTYDTEDYVTTVQELINDPTYLGW